MEELELEIGRWCTAQRCIFHTIRIRGVFSLCNRIQCEAEKFSPSGRAHQERRRTLVQERNSLLTSTSYRHYRHWSRVHILPTISLPLTSPFSRFSIQCPFHVPLLSVLYSNPSIESHIIGAACNFLRWLSTITLAHRERYFFITSISIAFTILTILSQKQDEAI